ncbi:MAG: flagellar assembly protein FliH [Cellvibrionaceae bacterium]|nr:flagellar assembly protein FliH [Cellvibrionaceae bacterium]
MQSTPGFSKSDLAQCSSWLLPDVSSAPLLVASAKKEAQQQQVKTPDKPAPAVEIDAADTDPDCDTAVSSETIEETVQPLTAEQLEEITRIAEKDGFANGYEKGLEQGLQQGMERGLNDARDKIQQQCQSLQHIVEALLIPLEKEHSRLETLMVDMICQLTRAVVQGELQTQTVDITQMVANALALLPAGTACFTLYVNPQDLALIEQYLPLSEQDYQLRVDENLLRGGCRLESQHSRIDASMETRLEKILDDFLHKRLPEPLSEKPPAPTAIPSTTASTTTSTTPTPTPSTTTHEAPAASTSAPAAAQDDGDTLP